MNLANKSTDGVGKKETIKPKQTIPRRSLKISKKINL